MALKIGSYSIDPYLALLGIYVLNGILALYVPMFLVMFVVISPILIFLMLVTDGQSILKGQLWNIIWAHGVNNQKDLEKSLNNERIMVIVADVTLGKANGGEEDIPIMGLPSEESSDSSSMSFFEQIRASIMGPSVPDTPCLSLRSFLQQIKNHNRNKRSYMAKHVKLNFSSIEVFEKSVGTIAKFEQTYRNFRVWINADILPGPVDATTTPVDAKRFLVAARDIPNCTLSLGWTTQYGSAYSGSYNAGHILTMTNTIYENFVDHNINFCVRAGLAAQSRDILVRFMNAFKYTKLIIFSTPGDNVNIEDLKQLIREIGPRKIFPDVPEDMFVELRKTLVNRKYKVWELMYLFSCLIITIIVMYYLVLEFD